MILRLRLPAALLVLLAAALGSSSAVRAANVQRVDDKVVGESVKISGFSEQGTGWKVNSNGISSPPFPAPNVLRLTDNKPKGARSAFFEKPLLVAVGSEGFVAEFTYTASGNKDSDGVAFVLHNDPRGPEAIGGYGSGLGVGAAFGGTPITPSVEFEIKLWRGLGVAWRDNATNGPNESYGSTSPVNIASGRPIDIRLAYDPTTLTLAVKLTDQTTKDTFNTSYKAFDVVRILGGSTAYVGFAGSTATDWSIQEISNFSYSVGGGAAAAPGASIKLSGFGGEGTGWTVNSNKNSINPPFPSKDTLRLTNNDIEEARSAFYDRPVPVVSGSKGFTASFTYRATGDRDADGAAFVLHNDARGESAVGGHGGALGLGAENMGGAITPSVEFEFNLWKTHGVAWQSHGDAGNYAPTDPVNVGGGNPIDVTLSYDPATTTLAVKLVDQTTKATYTTTYNTLDVTGILGRNTAYVGFSGGSGRSRSIQHISNFSYVVGDSSSADRLVGFEKGALVFQSKFSATSTTKIPLADIISVTLDDQDRAAPATGSKKASAPTTAASSGSAQRWRVELDPADHVTASLAGWTDARLALAVDSLGAAPLSFPVERVRAIWSTNAAKVKEAKDLNLSADSQDVAFVESEGKVKSVTGVAAGLDKDFLKFKYDGEERRIKLERLVGVLLAQRELPAEKSLFETVTFTSGDVVSGRIESLADGVFRIAPLAPTGDAGIVELPLAGIATIEVKNGRIAWLSDLVPKSIAQIPFLDRLMPYRVNTSLTGGPLVMNDGAVSKGIAVHTKCTLDYEIGGRFDRFRTKVGFQQPEGKSGRAPVRIRGDGKVLWEQAELKGDAKKPAIVDLSVSGVKTLSLEADFGPNQDVAGRVVWGEARLVKAASK